LEEKEFLTKAFSRMLLLLTLSVLLVVAFDVQRGTTAKGCVVVRVQYQDGFPRSDAEVYVLDPTPDRYIGTTNESGLFTRCGYLSSGQYSIKAEWPIGTQFGPNTTLVVDSNGDGNATVTAGYEITPPTIHILSPQNQTYVRNYTSLNYTIDDYSAISWAGYNLDGQANVTITGNTTLTNIPLGGHSIVVYSNDTFGNMGFSETVSFTRVNGSVVVRVQYIDGSPRSGADVFKVYPKPDTELGNTVEDGRVVSWGVLDPGEYNVSAFYPSGVKFGDDSALVVGQNGNGSTTITAPREITPPTVQVLSPQNLTYMNRSIPLTFAVYDYSLISWMGYSLDGQPNTTVTGNTSLSIGIGTHHIVLYANDTFGNMGVSETVSFTRSSCVTVTVVFADDHTVEDALIGFRQGTTWTYFGITNTSGQVRRCDLPLLGNYTAYAYYPNSSTLFGNSSLAVDDAGSENATIRGSYEMTPPVVQIFSPQNQTYINSSIPLTYTIHDYSAISWTGYSLDGQADIAIAGNTTLTNLSDGSHNIIVYSNDTHGNMGPSQTVYFTVQTTFQVTFKQAGVALDFAGTVVVVDGVNYKATDLPVSFNWTVLSTHTFAYQSPLIVTANGKQYAWIGTTGLTTAQNGSIVVSSSGNVTGNYKPQFYLTVYSLYGTKGGEGWYNAGTAAYATLNSGIIDLGNGTGLMFTGWSRDASGTNYARSDPLTMDRPQTAVANWKTQLYLTVKTDPTNTTTIPGEGWYGPSTNVSLAAASVADYQFSYWDIDGVSQGKGVNPITVNMNATHTATAHYSKNPPQAAFTYHPVDSYVNVTITFDASASTAGRSNDTIVKYEWDFGDGTPKVSNTSFITTHAFAQVTNYNVTLNITNSEGLWSTTSRILTILPPIGPTADFMLYPATPKANQTVTFDATMSKPGYNGTHHLPIVNYTWDFGDGNVTSGNYPTIVHRYMAYGDYMAKLNVTDINGFKGYVTKTVRVRVSALTGDINGDRVVDIYDAIMLANSYNLRLGDANWNPNADINNDGEVDIYDAIILAGNYGKTAP
jgi:hypothetical protein